MNDIQYDSSYGALKTKYEECCDSLGVKITDSPEVIRKQFKMLALQYHPDKNHDSDAEEKFIEIRKAYEYIINHTFIVYNKHNRVHQSLSLSSSVRAQRREVSLSLS